MGAIFFYIFIYFIGYYASNVLNMLTVRPLVTNRYMAALVPVYGFAFGHAYMVVTKPLPAGGDITVEYALLVFIALPVVVVTMGAAYFMWNSKGKEEHADEKSAANNQESSEATPAEINVQKTEVHLHLHSHSHLINIGTEASEQKIEKTVDVIESSGTSSASDSPKNKDSKDA